MSSFTQTITETFFPVSCYACSCRFAINCDMYNRAVKNKSGLVFCPACKSGTRWTGKTEAEKVREKMQQELDTANRRADTANRRANRQAEIAETATRSLSATKGVVTRLKNRASKGICPCCSRHFANVQRHMEKQHPNFVESE